jgi:hypothetical protein
VERENKIMSEVGVKCVHTAYTLPEKAELLSSTAIHGLSSNTVEDLSEVRTGWHPEPVNFGPDASVALQT